MLLLVLPANFTMESRIFLSLSLIWAFLAAALSIKFDTAAFSASMRLVRVVWLMASDILPEASSTITTSRGMGSVWVVEDVEDMADRATRKSDPALFSTDWSFSGPVVNRMGSASTVLSAQIRPMAEVLLPWILYQASKVFGSVIAAACAALDELPGSNACT